MHASHKLTSPQYNIWIDQQIYGDSPLYNIGGQVNIKGEIDYDLFNKSAQLLLKNNDILRASFDVDSKGTPYQVFLEYKNYKLPYLDFSIEYEPQSKANEWMSNNFNKVYNLKEDELFTLTLIKISDNHYIYFCMFHHLIMDGWSISLTIEQIRDAYNSLINNKKHNNIKPCSYIKFIQNDIDYISSPRFEKSKAYWKNKFLYKPESILSSKLFNTPRKVNDKCLRHNFFINTNDYSSLGKLGKEYGITIPNIILSLVYLYLNKVTGLKDIVIGIPLLNRFSKSFKKTVGLFIETSPVIVKIDNQLSLKDFFIEVKNTLGACYKHQRFPLNEIEKIANTSHYNSTYDVVFSHQVNSYEEKFNNFETIGIPMPSQHQKNALTIRVMESTPGKDVLVNLDYRPDIFDSFSIESFEKQFITLYQNVIDNPQAKISHLQILSKTEKNILLNDFNNTHQDFDNKNKTIIQLFNDQVLKRPNKTAVIFNNTQLSYKELDNKANIVGNYLNKNYYIKPNDKVSLVLNRSDLLIISILGVLKSGAAFVPIDPNYPKERIDYILEDSKSKFAITEDNINSILTSNEPITCPNVPLNSSSLLYIIYTSGSTGLPKGTLITNKNYCNYINWAKDYYFEDSQGGNFGLFTSISFDLTTTSIFLTLLRSKTLTVFKDKLDINDILEEVFNEGLIDSVKLTPSHITLLKEIPISNSNIKLAIVGGEELQKNQVATLNKINPRIKIYNEYGPTEATVGCIVKEVFNKDKKILIGKPIANTQIYILDDNLNPLPIGIPGEIYIGGKGVASGYLNRHELSNSKFIKSPFDNNIIYKSGDLAKWLPDGNIDYLGRIDDQVKINGHRIELDEIKNRILQFECITDVVITVNNNKNGTKFLTAYYVSDNEIEEKELKKYLRKYLPEYMVPTFLSSIEKIPLTINGKVDKKSLPKPGLHKAKSSAVYLPPESKLEKLIVSIWQDILDTVNPIGINDNFFELGGDSIKAIQIVSRLKQNGFKGQVSDILDSPTIKSFKENLVKVIDKSDQSLINGEVPLTPIQKWFFNDLNCPKHHYNQSLLLKTKKRFNSKSIIALKKTLIKILEHHDALRMQYSLNFDSYIQYNRSSAELFFKEFDLTSEVCPIKKIEELSNDVQSSFNLENDTLIRFVYFHLPEGGRLLIVSHHLVIDGVSWRILLEDIESGLKKALSGKEIDLPLKTTSYKNWSEHLFKYTMSSEFNDVANFWNSISDDKEDYTYGVVSTNSKKEKATISLTPDETKSLLTKVKTSLNANINDVLLTALAKSLINGSKKENILVDIESHGRSERFNNIDISRTIGWFTSIYPVLLDISDCNGIEDEIKSIKEILSDIPDYGIGFGILKYNSNRLRNQNSSNILFNYLGQFDNDINTELFEKSNDSTGLSVSPEAISNYDLVFNGIILEGQFSVTLESHLYEKETLKDILNTYISKIRKILLYINDKNNVNESIKEKDLQNSTTKKLRIRI